MRIAYVLAAVLGFVSSGIAADSIENPIYATWAKLKPGTTVVQKIITDSAGQKSETIMTYKLKEVTADKVVLDLVTKSKIAGVEFEAPAQPYEIQKMTPLPEGKTKEDVAKAKPEGVTSEGEETMKIGGKDYKTQWYKYKTKSGDFEMESQSWTSPDVPNMTVKMVSKTSGATASTTTLELVEIKVP